MKLYDLLDTNLLVQHAHNHLVGAQRHPTLPLRIYNYTQNAQREGDWNDGVLSYCRGLIVDDDDNIIERPFQKFFNFQTASMPETLEENLPKTTPTILEKYDGSLGVLWQYEGEYGIATRGSFMSPQAQWASKWLTDRVQGRVQGEHVFLPIDDGFTSLFEIIYNENRIVVQYPYEGLILIGLVHRETGYEQPYRGLCHIAQRDGLRVARRIDGRDIHDCVQDNIANEEGYVVTYDRGASQPPLKVKIKMADYVRLHKIVTGMNARSVWEILSGGGDMEHLDNTPAPFKKWLVQWTRKLIGEHDDILQRSIDIFDTRPYDWVTDAPTQEAQDREYRAKFAKFVSEQPVELRSILFAMLDKKDPSVLIWKSIKPRGDDQTFRTEGE